VDVLANNGIETLYNIHKSIQVKLIEYNYAIDENCANQFIRSGKRDFWF